MKSVAGNKQCIRATVRSTVFLLLSMMVLFAVSARTVRAQNSLGTVEGTVSDKTGKLVVDADVTVLNEDTGVAIKVKTNSDGYYRVPSLVPGSNYSVTIVKDGFEETHIPGVDVETSSTATISATLEVGKVSTTVTVTATGEMLSKDSSAVTTNMDEQLVDNLPYPEQGSLEVALLAPGVKGSQANPSGLATENPGIYIGNVEPGAQISINGASAGHSALLVDGADVTQSSFARAGITVSAGMAGQVTVITNGVPAQYGRTLGGVVVQSTKSGTNEYHGRVQWRHTDPLLQAQPDGLPLAPGLHQNFFGAFFGGPVVIPHLYDGHNKTFFFAGFEPARFSNSTGSYLAVLTPPELAGNFTGDINLLSPGTANQIYGIYYQSQTNSNGFPCGPVGPVCSVIPGDPYPVGTTFSGAANYVPIPNDDLTAQSAMNPFVQFLSSQLPTPSNPQHTKFISPLASYQNTASSYILTPGVSYEDNAFGIRTVANQDNRFAFRIDHTLSNSDRMYVRYSNTPIAAQRSYLVNPSSPLDPFPSDTSRAQNILVDETHVLTSSLLNEFKVSYLRNKQNRPAPSSALTQDWGAKYGLISATAGVGFPSISNVDGGVGTNQIFFNTDTTSLLQDDFTIVSGRHKIQFGVDLRRLQSNQDNRPGLFGGNYTINAASTNGCQLSYYTAGGTCTSAGGVGYAALTLGLISSFSNQSADVVAHYRWQYYAGYVQDDFRVLPNVTLNIGVRYEVETPRKELNDLQGTFVPRVHGDLDGAAAQGAFCFSAACGLPHTIFPMNYKGVQPRVGIAWNPRPRVTVRSSYAILRVPLTGLSNTPLPNFGLAANSIGGLNGGEETNVPVDYITNPIATSVVSALQFLKAGKGPYFYVPGNLTIPYVNQSSTVPYSQQWSFTLQFQLLRKTLIEAGYNGSRGIHLFNNAQNPQNLPNMNQVFADINQGYSFTCSAVAATASCPGIVSNPYPYAASTNGTPVSLSLLQSLMPYPALYNQSAGISELYNRQGTSSYHALYIAGTHHFDRGLSMQASFTWSKSLDNDGSDSAASGSAGFAAALQHPGNFANEKAVSDFDVPARFITGFVYMLPYGKRSHELPTSGSNVALRVINRTLNTVFGDWSTGGIFRAESSTPFLPTLGRTSTTQGPVGYWFSTGNGTPACIANARNCPGSSTALPFGINPRPNIVPGVPCINPLWGKTTASHFGSTYINPQAFTIPGYTTSTGTLGVGENYPAYGNAPRTMANCRSPRQINFDANVSKTIPFKNHPKMSLAFTITATNAFNHPLYFFNGATTNDSSGNNGQLFTSYATGVTAAPRTGIDNPGIGFSLPPGFTVSNYFGTVNPAFTAQFSRVVQVGAAFNF